MNMRRALGLLVVGLLVAVGGVGAADEAELDALVERGRKALEAGRLERVKEVGDELLREATAQKRDDYLLMGHFFLAEFCLQTAETAAALNHYQTFTALATRLKLPADAAYGELAIGTCQETLGQPEEAIAAFDRSAALYRAEQDLGMAGYALTMAGGLHIAASRFEEALRYSRQAVELLQETEEHEHYLQALLQLGRIVASQGEVAEARQHYETAETTAREALLPDWRAAALNHLGNLDVEEGKPESAVERFTKALEIVGEDGEPELRAAVLVNLGEANHALGETRRAVRAFEQAISLAREHELPDGLATALTSQAVMLTDLGHLDESMAALEEARAIRLELGDTLGLHGVEINIANVLMQRGELREALATYLRIAEQLEKAGLKSSLATVYNNIGRLYDTQADLTQAISYFERAAELAIAVNNPALTATALNNAALAIYNQVQPALPLANLEEADAKEIRELLTQAREWFQQAHDLLETMGERRLRATVLNNLGQIDGELGEEEQAVEQLRQALELHRSLGQRVGVCQTTANLGLRLFEQADLDAAADYLNEALELAEQIGEVEIHSLTLFNLGLVDQARGDLPAGITKLYQALELTEARRARLGGGETQQRQFLQNNLRFYVHLLELLLEAGRTDEAFAVAERAHGRALLDMMEGGRVDLRERLPAEQLARLTELEQSVAAATTSLSEVVGRSETREQQLEAPRAALEAAREALAHEEKRLAGLHPELAASSGQQPLDLAGAAAALPADTALLEYQYGTTAVHLFVVTSAGPTRLRHYTLTAETALDEQVEALHRACANPRRRYKSEAAALYRVLLAPALAELPEGIKRLVIVADNALFECPFHALWDEARERFVMDDYEVVYAASASLLGATLRLGAERRREPPGRGMLLVADPDFGSRGHDEGGTREALPAVARGFNLAPLPGTRAEAEAIKEVVEGVELLAGKEAQEAAVKQRMGGHRYLHFATHGLYDPEAPLYSAVALAEPAEPVEDGFMQARELTRLNLRAELVTLSACQTGRGVTEPGEGLIGLPWAFFVARVPTQVVSLWSVDDFMTKELMARFYANLQKGQPKATALRQAALDLRANPPRDSAGRTVNTSHPFYWAPFIVMGDWQ